MRLKGSSMNEQEKLEFALLVLRIIAMSYRERIDPSDTPAYVFADEALQHLGVDIEAIPDETSVLKKFREWRYNRYDPR